MIEDLRAMMKIAYIQNDLKIFKAQPILKVKYVHERYLTGPNT